MKVEYNFKPYKVPKKAIYYVNGNDYIKDPTTGLLGWSRIERESLVIGEDDLCFVTEIVRHINCDTSEPDYGKLCLLPMGFHKSRLIKWISSPGDQLELFAHPQQE